MNLADLTDEDRAELVRQFKIAAIRRAQQWEAESAIEAILGEEVELGIENWAVMVDTPFNEELSKPNCYWTATPEDVLEAIQNCLTD